MQALEARSTREPDDDQQVALAEIALLTAMRLESSDPTTAAHWYVLAAARSYDFLFVKASVNPPFDLRYERMRVFYLRALAGFLQHLTSTNRYGPSLHGAGSQADLTAAPAADRSPRLMTTSYMTSAHAVPQSPGEYPGLSPGECEKRHTAPCSTAGALGGTAPRGLCKDFLWELPEIDYP